MLCYIVLAAGQSKRFKSDVSKVLFKLHGKTILDYALEAIPAPKNDIFIVANFEHEGYKCIPQKAQLGTGHAVQEALKQIPQKYTECIILCGDVPLIERSTLRELVESVSDLTLVGFHINDFTKPYGRILNNGEAIVEYKEASQDVKNNSLAYSGVMKASRKVLDETLPKLKPHPELYLTEIVEKCRGSRSIIFKTEEEFAGINTRADLAYIERCLQKKWINKLMEQGAVFYNPETSSVRHDTNIAADVIVHPNVQIGRNVTIEKGAVIHPFTALENCHIKEGVNVGPFAHIRGDVVLERESVVGNFVEIKGSKIGQGSKVKHLSYIGDAVLGKNVNVGAGTITCNYDGVNKHKTVIEDDAFIGSNSTLIAPITIHDHAFIGADTVLSEDVEAYDLALTRAPKKIVKGWRKNRSAD
ncbi:MAG: bifunctional UDP-N-acetylglucosamine diphosphorylase/glucosamine-1-phosphate N-acetyltransferase GlmU [Alphaproteobacteria bacterium]|nr:MAG: bifunctional UDP-N-acetylglucosamine diphosphorylase/glucosamine-1-phosphate N-acetyltransferase GlmU [Alphaproteobacteria bacterium]